MKPSVPCTRCNTLNGLAWRSNIKAGEDPRRASGARYGRDGMFCLPCFQWVKAHPVVPPCARCGIPEGTTRYHRPTRVSGVPYGFNGDLCKNCYTTCRRKVANERVKAGAVPCTKCKTLGGYAKPDCVTPSRVSGAPFGFNGVLCKRCYDHHTKKAAARETVPLRRFVDPAREYVPERTAMIRRFKHLLERAGVRPVLNQRELDAMLPPLDCLRTRLRADRHSVENCR